MKKLNIIIAVIICTTLFSCKQNTTTNSLEEIKIENQYWASTNLDNSVFKNGDPIAEAKTNEEWEKFGSDKKPAWCYYNNDETSNKKYGKLYNWFAINDSRGLAPNGWRIPSDDDWETLASNLGNSLTAGTKMRSTNGWEPNDNATNSSGFSGLPGGFREGDGNFKDIGITGFWWTTTISQEDYYNPWSRNLYRNASALGRFDSFHPSYGLSVRCIKNVD